MPELPEVETIKNELLPYVLGRTITDVVIFLGEDGAAAIGGGAQGAAGRAGKSPG